MSPEAGRCSSAPGARFGSLLDDWPTLTRGHEARSFSSFDRTGGNADGFNGTYSELYETESGEHVIFDAVGPGILDTLWFTGPEEGGAGLDLGTVRFYLDDETSPRVALPWGDLFSGDVAPFLAPLVADNTVTTGAFASWVPVPYARRLVVTTEKRASFYQAHYETLPVDTELRSFEPCDDLSRSREAFRAALEFQPRTDVESVPLDLTRSGEGTLDTIQFEPATTPSDADLESSRIRIAWDGEVTPSVDAPLGSFFGSGLGPAEVRALPFSIGKGVYESRFRMPYFRGFHLTITGIAGALRIHVSPGRYARGQAGYFHAFSSEERATTPGKDFEYLAAAGAGRLVGTVLTVRPATPTTKKWWEGDLRSFQNGRRTPGIEGTGHEDDHLAGWSNTLFEGPFTLPMQGEPRADILDLNGQYNANATFYRFYPGIEYLDGIRHSTEHGSGNTVAGDYRGVTFYYADPGEAPLVEADALTVVDDAARAAHAYVAEGESPAQALSSAFEGHDAVVSLTASSIAHTGRASFDMSVSASNLGCFLRRVYDQQVGRQRAEVRADGELVGTFYTAESNATLRWAERDYFLPPRFTAGKTRTHIEIVPTPGSPPWSVVDYRMLCISSSEGAPGDAGGLPSDAGGP